MCLGFSYIIPHLFICQNILDFEGLNIQGLNLKFIKRPWAWTSGIFQSSRKDLRILLNTAIRFYQP